MSRAMAGLGEAEFVKRPYIADIMRRTSKQVGMGLPKPTVVAFEPEAADAQSKWVTGRV